ncbi:reverse transcriptase domain-containing protein [Tanacetum coccineum]
MKEGDEDKTTLFTRKGVFCYMKMPFGFKNTLATYQKLVDKVLNDQIGRNLEAYVDDMVIKSASEEDMLLDIQETFDMLRSINMKLNLKKCSFESKGNHRSQATKDTKGDTKSQWEIGDAKPFLLEG